MNIERYKPNGYKDISANLTPAAADTIYNAHLPMVQTPFAKYYRIVVTGDGGRIIRDTDHEVFGRQTIAPGTLMFHGVDKTEHGTISQDWNPNLLHKELKFNPNHDLLNWDGVE